MSSLQKQLQHIDSSQNAAVHIPHRISFLFDLKQAAEIDASAIFTIGVDGLADLVRIDGGFTRFRDTLFSDRLGAGSAVFDRSVQSQDVCGMCAHTFRFFLLCMSLVRVLLFFAAEYPARNMDYRFPLACFCLFPASLYSQGFGVFNTTLSNS